MSEETITIKKDQLWKYSTIALLLIVVVGGFMMFNNGSPTGSVIRDAGDGGAVGGDFEKLSATYEEIIDDDAVSGSADATITIVEFSDYECPFCQRHVTQVQPEIDANYISTGKVKHIFRDFTPTLANPSYHPMSDDAGMAAECVRNLGGDEKYFEYHDVIFENQGSLSVENLKSWASDLGYDIGNCLDNEIYKVELQKDLTDGTNLGIVGTPGFLILMSKDDADLDALKGMYYEQSGRVLVQAVETEDGYVGVRIGGAFPYSTFAEAFEAGL
jgi:hypothetical protein